MGPAANLQDFCALQPRQLARRYKSGRLLVCAQHTNQRLRHAGAVQVRQQLTQMLLVCLWEGMKGVTTKAGPLAIRGTPPDI